MLFTKTDIPGAWVVEPEKKADERGFFARIWCREEFRRRGLDPVLDQCSLSFNEKKGTLRGMHFQKEPHAEDKLVMCQAGGIYDVVVDLRPGSPAYKKWIAVELTASSRKMIYIPKGCAHGFQTLEDRSEVFYMISTAYAPESASGVRWDDPAFGIRWPGQDRIISEKDRSWPDFID